MDIINIFQNLGIPVSCLIITIYAVKCLYSDITTQHKEYENMLIEKLELITKTNQELAETNKKLVTEFSNDIKELNSNVNETNNMIQNIFNNR